MQRMTLTADCGWRTSLEAAGGGARPTGENVILRKTLEGLPWKDLKGGGRPDGA